MAGGGELANHTFRGEVLCGSSLTALGLSQNMFCQFWQDKPTSKVHAGTSIAPLDLDSISNCIMKFEKHFPKQTQNINGCNQLNSEAKAAFFTEIDSIDEEDKVAVEQAAEKHFHKNSFRGNVVELTLDERLGHLQRWSSFIDFIRSIAPSKDAEKDKLDETINKVSGGELDAVDAVNEMLDLLGLGETPMTPLVWCFRTRTQSPFVGLDLDSLPCRLGLHGNLDKANYFPMEITPPAIEIRTPTAFDAGMFEHWCPGGKTCPRDEDQCKGQEGLEEVVINGGLAYKHVKTPTNL